MTIKTTHFPARPTPALAGEHAPRIDQSDLGIRPTRPQPSTAGTDATSDMLRALPFDSSDSQFGQPVQAPQVAIDDMRFAGEKEIVSLDRLINATLDSGATRLDLSGFAPELLARVHSYIRGRIHQQVTHLTLPAICDRAVYLDWGYSAPEPDLTRAGRKVDVDTIGTLPHLAVPKTARKLPMHFDAAIRNSERGAAATLELSTVLFGLTSLYEGQQRAAPALAMSQGRTPDVPRALVTSFREFLASDRCTSHRFRRDNVAQVPTVDFTFTSGKHMAYNMFTVPEGGDGRHVVITIGGFTADSAVGPSAASRFIKHPLRSAGQAVEIIASALGRETEAKEFGEQLGRWIEERMALDPDTRFVINGHSYGAVAAARAVQHLVSQGLLVKGQFTYPAPLPEPLDRAAFDAGMAALGGADVLQTVLTEFDTPGDPVAGVRRGPVRHILARTHQNWDISGISTRFDMSNPHRRGVENHDHPADNIATGFNGQAVLPMTDNAVPQDIRLLTQLAHARELIDRAAAERGTRL